jgi:hypothetical protein
MPELEIAQIRQRAHEGEVFLGDVSSLFGNIGTGTYSKEGISKNEALDIWRGDGDPWKNDLRMSGRRDEKRKELAHSQSSRARTRRSGPLRDAGSSASHPA